MRKITDYMNSPSGKMQQVPLGGEDERENCCRDHAAITPDAALPSAQAEIGRIRE